MSENNKKYNKKFNNLSISSYNILWEIMNYDNTKRFINTDKKLLKIYKNNILFNIQKIIDYYNPTIYCFQEAASYNDILKLFDENYLYKINKSDKEFMLTVWQNEKIDLIASFKGEFEKGRPFIILIFFNKIENYKFILINIHAGHDVDTNISILKPIQDVLDTIDKKLLIDIERVIIAGDFNRDINNQIKINKKNYYLVINNKKITFKYNKNNNNTCCDIYGKNFNKNYDNIIDSYKKLKLIHPLNKESWYKYPSSDHVMIMGIIKTPLEFLSRPRF